MSNSVNPAGFEMPDEEFDESGVGHPVRSLERSDFFGKPGEYAAKNALDFEAMLRERKNKRFSKGLKSVESCSD